MMDDSKRSFENRQRETQVTGIRPTTKKSVSRRAGCSISAGAEERGRGLASGKRDVCRAEAAIAPMYRHGSAAATRARSPNADAH